MRILITGATGFIGSAFARLALSRGHEIGGLVVPAEPIPAGLRDHNGVSWFRGTLSEAPWAEIGAFRADICVHTAWITTPGVYLESPENERFRDVSLEFLLKLFERGTRRVFGLGTCIEYQIENKPLNEANTPVVPTTTYARCKNELRIALEREAQARGFAMSWGRVFYPYGPGEHPSRLCTSIIQRLARGERIMLKTPESTKDYIYIDDLAAALLKVAESDANGVVNLGTGIGTSVRQLAQRLAGLLGRTELVEEAQPAQADPFPFVVADVARLKALGWSQKVSIEDGLQRLKETMSGAKADEGR